MELSLPLVKPIALVRPRGTHRFEAFSAKLQRRVTFCRCSLHELWVLLETDPAVVAFCERPGYIQMEGRLRLPDFLVRYVGHDEFSVLTDCVNDSGVCEAMSLQSSIDGNAITIRRVAPAELAAARVWIENWQRMLPYVIANQGLILPTLSEAIVRFVAAS
jgi:branched-subunit amino acid transport protein